MLAKLANELTVGEYLYEPKWDGFRAIVFRGEEDVFVQNRDSRPWIAIFRSCTSTAHSPAMPSHRARGTAFHDTAESRGLPRRQLQCQII